MDVSCNKRIIQVVYQTYLKTIDYRCKQSEWWKNKICYWKIQSIFIYTAGWTHQIRNHKEIGINMWYTRKKRIPEKCTVAAFDYKKG